MGATMDELRFARFCESSKRLPASDANFVFAAVVNNVQKGMELKEFKQALTLLVNSDNISRSQQGESKEREPLHGHACTPRAVLESSPTFQWSPDLSDSVFEGEDCLAKQSRTPAKKRTRT